MRSLEHVENVQPDSVVMNGPSEDGPVRTVRCETRSSFKCPHKVTFGGGKFTVTAVPWVNEQNEYCVGHFSLAITFDRIECAHCCSSTAVALGPTVLESVPPANEMLNDFRPGHKNTPKLPKRPPPLEVLPAEDGTQRAAKRARSLGKQPVSDDEEEDDATDMSEASEDDVSEEAEEEDDE